MPQTLEDVILLDVIPLVRTALARGAELTGAVQTLTQRIDELTAELAEGEVGELRRLLASALRPRHPVP